MKKLKIYFGAVALMLLATQCNMLPWFPVDPNPYVEPVIALNDSNFYAVQLGDTVTIQLKSNFTAGYHWSWINKEACDNVDSLRFDYVLDNNDPNICGSGGTELWTFKGVSSGTDTLRFVCNRPENMYISTRPDGKEGLAEETKSFVIQVRSLKY